LESTYSVLKHVKKSFPIDSQALAELVDKIVKIA